VRQCEFEERGILEGMTEACLEFAEVGHKSSRRSGGRGFGGHFGG
jgi:hypothetical protein